ncbi:MAG: hypothetical protein HXY25_06620 [Alphaproteobacteria bacterium]|nr:hypothetical protein [Alphaproteobacteria bacterium]
METYFDWITVLAFMIIAGTFFYRVRAEDPPLVLYVGLSIGCAIANWLGNEGHVIPAFVAIGAVVGGYLHVGWSERRPGRG